MGKEDHLGQRKAHKQEKTTWWRSLGIEHTILNICFTLKYALRLFSTQELFLRSRPGSSGGRCSLQRASPSQQSRKWTNKKVSTHQIEILFISLFIYLCVHLHDIYGHVCAGMCTCHGQKRVVDFQELVPGIWEVPSLLCGYRTPVLVIAKLTALIHWVSCIPQFELVLFCCWKLNPRLQTC